MRLLLQAILLLVLTTSLHAQTPHTVHLSGKTYRPVDTLILIKPYEDIRYQGIKIPVASDSTFTFELQANGVETYDLIFLSEFKASGWREITFFTDTDNLEFALYPMDGSEKNRITGSDLVNQKIKFEERRVSLFKDSFMQLYQEKGEFEEDTAEADLFQSRVDSLNGQMAAWQHRYFSVAPTVLGLSEYYKVLDNLDKYGLTKEDIIPIHNFWTSEFPQNDLTPIIENRFSAQELSTFKDFDLLSATDKTGDLASTILSAEYTLLDLWSPWCGPCLKKSKNVEHAYQVLNEGGLRIVGVMGGIPDLESYQVNMQKHNYSWPVYHEIKDKQAIWHKYDLTYGGGGQFLISAKGEIIAINPTVSELLTIIGK